MTSIDHTWYVLHISDYTVYEKDSVCVYRNTDDRWSIADGGGWFPGQYEDFKTALMARELSIRLGTDAILQTLQTEANARAGGTGGTVRMTDVLAAGGR
jgi:hypothetical protein